MGRAPARENPFRPGAGAIPPVLAGRDADLDVAGRLLDSLVRGRAPSQGLLFFGPRGNGKTALLARIAEETRRRRMRAEDLPGASFRDPDTLTRQLQENAGLTGRRLKGVKAGGFAVSSEPGPPTKNAAKLLARWIGEGNPPLVILLDEAHTIEPDAGRIFFNAVQAATGASLPLLLVAAGTPDAPHRLRKAGTFTERALRRRRVGRLTRPDTLRALEEPARNSGLPMAEEAAAFLAAQSQDYPYFIQWLGSAAWESAVDADAREITMESAREGTAAARPDLETFYAERFDEARGRGVHRALTPLAALVSQRGGWLDDEALDDFLARESGAHTEAGLLRTLRDLGALWETESAVWEMGIPSFAEHILARRRARAPDVGTSAPGVGSSSGTGDRLRHGKRVLSLQRSISRRGSRL